VERVNGGEDRQYCEVCGALLTEDAEFEVGMCENCYRWEYGEPLYRWW